MGMHKGEGTVTQMERNRAREKGGRVGRRGGRAAQSEEQHEVKGAEQGREWRKRGRSCQRHRKCERGRTEVSGGQDLETNLASRWEGVRLPRASEKSRTSPKVPRTSPEVPGDFPRSSLKCPEVPRKFPRLPLKLPGLPRKSPDFPRGQPLVLGSLTPSPDSQKLSLKGRGRG